jgi:hypothetical protein
MDHGWCISGPSSDKDGNMVPFWSGVAPNPALLKTTHFERPFRQRNTTEVECPQLLDAGDQILKPGAGIILDSTSSVRPAFRDMI